jgi:excisionase family DNA binding protein
MRQSETLTTAQVAKVLGVSRQTLYNWLREGRIAEPPRHPLTNHMRWKAEDVARIQRAFAEVAG